MKKIFGVMIVVAILATLILNGLVLRQVTWLAEENTLLKNELKQEVVTASRENLAEVKSAKDELKTQIISAQETLREELGTAKTENLIQTNAVGNKLEKQIAENQKELNKNLGEILREIKNKNAELENKIFQPAEVYKKFRKAVVRTESLKGGASGFVYAQKNQVITAKHAVGLPGTTVNIYLDGKNDDAIDAIIGRVKKIDPKSDLAAIELPFPLDVEPLQPADIKDLAVGTQVIAIGNPVGRDNSEEQFMLANSVSSGIISGFNRKSPDMPLVSLIQIDSAVDFGNSGGPVLTEYGVIGVIIRVTSMNFTFALAVPIEYVEKMLAQ